MRYPAGRCIGFVFLGLALYSSGRCVRALPASRMTYLDNGEVRIGMDLALGGAVTFLSGKDRAENLINSADLGRQIQMSHYSGPWPFEPEGKKPKKEWAGLGWNPIQTGDCYLNPSKVLEHRNDGKQVYIRCVPMQWPHSNVPGDCLFETWTTLEGPVVHMRFRCTNQRADKRFYRACPQELPAVYAVSKLSRLMSYTGDKPFTGDTLTHVTNDFRRSWPWTRFIATEGWAALVDEQGWGLGVFKQDCGEFHGGVFGTGRTEDPKDGSTAYVAPIHRENFDHNIVYEHETDLMVGRIEAIRERFNGLARKSPPVWKFEKDRQHWVLHNARDEGLPLRGEWRVRFSEQESSIESAPTAWRAEQAPKLILNAAAVGEERAIRIFWRRLGQEEFSVKQSAQVTLSSGEPRRAEVKLEESPEYSGLIIGLRVEPVERNRPCELRIRSMEMSGF